jgi:hypothetical protein
MPSPYEPVKHLCCPECGGSGLMDARDPRTLGPYEPIGLKECPLCRGSGVVTEADLRAAFKG